MRTIRWVRFRHLLRLPSQDRTLPVARSRGEAFLATGPPSVSLGGAEKDPSLGFVSAERYGGTSMHPLTTRRITNRRQL